MNDVAIQVENLGKRYRIGSAQAHHDTLRDAISDFVGFNRQSKIENQKLNNTIWALRNVSFQVKRSHVLGIIGRNGAGKSTLLKILSRVTRPTTGRAVISGRVGSLLEVGTGFHPELSGRENIYLNAAILGMKRTEIDRRFAEIVEFAEIERFLDTPVKRYSTGMYMRLAFSIAAHLEPEILIVDEVLAVGDAAFQKKCLGKMGNVAQEGRTVLFVSHNMTAVQSLCHQVLWLHEGQIVSEGAPAQVVSAYLQTSASSSTEQVWNDQASAPGNEQVRLQRVCVRPAGGESSQSITMRTPIVLEFEFWNLVQGVQLYLNFQLITEQGIVAFASNPVDQSGWHGRPLPIGLFCSKCHIPGDLLIEGRYCVRLSAIKDDSYVVYQIDDVLIFDVQDSVESRTSWYGERVGTVRPLLKWTTELVESPNAFVPEQF